MNGHPPRPQKRGDRTRLIDLLVPNIQNKTRNKARVFSLVANMFSFFQILTRKDGKEFVHFSLKSIDAHKNPWYPMNSQSETVLILIDAAPRRRGKRREGHVGGESGAVPFNFH